MEQFLLVRTAPEIDHAKGFRRPARGGGEVDGGSQLPGIDAVPVDGGDRDFPVQYCGSQPLASGEALFKNVLLGEIG